MSFSFFDLFTQQDEPVEVHIPIDQFDPVHEGLAGDQYVIDMTEGSDGVWRATSVAIKVVLNHRM